MEETGQLSIRTESIFSRIEYVHSFSAWQYGYSEYLRLHPLDDAYAVNIRNSPTFEENNRDWRPQYSFVNLHEIAQQCVDIGAPANKKEQFVSRVLNSRNHRTHVVIAIAAPDVGRVVWRIMAREPPTLPFPLYFPPPSFVNAWTLLGLQSGLILKMWRHLVRGDSDMNASIVWNMLSGGVVLYPDLGVAAAENFFERIRAGEDVDDGEVLAFKRDLLVFPRVFGGGAPTLSEERTLGYLTGMANQQIIISQRLTPRIRAAAEERGYSIRTGVSLGWLDEIVAPLAPGAPTPRIFWAPWHGPASVPCSHAACVASNPETSEDFTKLQRCARCKRAFYCSQECQRAAWPTHRSVCVAPQSENN